MNIYKSKNKGRALSGVEGFTLIELIVTIGIIAVLATIVMVNVGSQVSKARDAQRRNDLDMIAKSVKMYCLEKGSAPEKGYSNWCTYISNKIYDFGEKLSPYLPNLPMDPRLKADGSSTVGDYWYFEQNGDKCKFTMCAVLENPISGFAPTQAQTCAGIGWQNAGYNYCVSY